MSTGESEYCKGVLGRESVEVLGCCGLPDDCFGFVENQRSIGNVGCSSSCFGGFLCRGRLSEDALRLNDIAERLCAARFPLCELELAVRGDGGRVRTALMLSCRRLSTECREGGSELGCVLSDFGCW